MKKLYFLWVLFAFPLLVFSQTGTIKIFTELGSVKVYLDEDFKGVDVKVLDSVQIGSHYLRVTKDEINIYGELVSVSQGSVTTILIKNDSEVQSKVLDAKYKEQENYKLKKIEILLSTNYATETTGRSASTYFPGYYVGTISTNSVSSSQTTAYTDWFIVQGGANRISDVQFAELTNNSAALSRYKADKAKLDNQVRSKTITSVASGVVALGFLGGAISEIRNDSREGAAVLSVIALIFAVPILSPQFNEKNIRAKYKWQSHYMTAEEALKSAQQYNLDLKKNLGLPENYEPK